MYNVIVAGNVMYRVATFEEAEKKLEVLRHSFLAMVHCKESFYIRKVA